MLPLTLLFELVEPCLGCHCDCLVCEYGLKGVILAKVCLGSARSERALSEDVSLYELSRDLSKLSTPRHFYYPTTAWHSALFV